MASKRLKNIPKYHRDAEKQLKDAIYKIRQRRESLGWSQEECAEHIGLNVYSYRSIEAYRRYPSLPMLYYICRSLNIKITIG